MRKWPLIFHSFRVMTIEYIYDPESVEGVLARYPLIRQEIKKSEAQETENFPNARKTFRQIYRVLSNTHYPHLCDLLDSLEYCLASDWRQPRLLKTRGDDFGSAVSELYVAKWFLRNGFAVRGFDDAKGTGPVPDMLVQAKNFSLVAEIYCPRDWDGLEQFEDELRLGILHVDLPWDFCCELEIGPISEFGPDGKPLLFDPWQFSNANDTPQKRLQIIEPILTKVKTHLQTLTEPFFHIEANARSISILARFKEVRRSIGRVPSRDIYVSAPTLSGYAPERMFGELLRNRITQKIRKGQLQSASGETLKALIVDVSRLGYVAQFEHNWYLSQFRQAVKKYLNLTTMGIDLVLFCLVGSSDVLGVRVLMKIRKPGLEDDLIDRLLQTGEIPDKAQPKRFLQKPRPSKA
jgi:hypothetical protein